MTDRGAEDSNRHAAPRLLTVPEVMAVLGISRWAVYQAIWSNRLATVAIGRCRRVSVDALTDYVALLGKETSP